MSNKELVKLKEYKRYQVTADGVSPRSIPGQPGGVHLANSDEHDEEGFTIEGFTPQIRIQQVEKRMAKLNYILQDLPIPQLFGPKEAEITLIGWGSTKGVVLEALKYVEGVNYLHVTAPWPLNEETLRRAVHSVKRLICIENNAVGQFANILRELANIDVDERILKYDGAQFFPTEIVEAVNKFK